MSEATVMKNDKKYELRALQSKDIFPMVRIISCIGIKEFKGCFESDDVKAVIADMNNGKKEIDANIVGISVMIDVADVIISHIADAEKYIYQLLANLSGMSKNELETLDIVTFTEMIIDVCKKDEFRDFIKVASRYVK